MFTHARLPISFFGLVFLPSSSPGAPAPLRKLYATLTAGAEVPGPGKEDASGSVRVELYAPKRLCYFGHLAGLADATQAHIHEGATGRSGPPVITLKKPEPEFQGCAVVSHGLMYQLANSPRKFYINVHSTGFPNGALRGQLHR